MAFCSNCGNKIKDGSKFCEVCGVELQNGESDEHFAVILHCPQCGAVVNSFLGKCEYCGTEFRGLDASKSIKEFVKWLAEEKSEKQRIAIINNYPIPNTKEDIMDYMILASSNIGYREDLSDKDAEKYEQAWLTKFLQGYQKAKLVFAHDKEFAIIQKMYENTLMRMENVDKEHKIRMIRKIIMENLGTVCGVIVICIALIMDMLHLESSLVELVGAIVLIVSACNLKKRQADKLGYLLSVGSGLVTIALSYLYDNGSAVMLGGIVTTVVSAVSFFKQ